MRSAEESRSFVSGDKKQASFGGGPLSVEFVALTRNPPQERVADVLELLDGVLPVHVWNINDISWQSPRKTNPAAAADAMWGRATATATAAACVCYGACARTLEHDVAPALHRQVDHREDRRVVQGVAQGAELLVDEGRVGHPLRFREECAVRMRGNKLSISGDVRHERNATLSSV